MNRKVIVSNRIYLMLLWCVFVIYSFLVTTISLYEFKDNVSGDLESSFYSSVLKTALVISVFYMPIILLIRGVKGRSLRNLLSCVWISFLWFFQVLIEFGNRVAGWSTFSLSESIIVSSSYSFNVVLMALLFYVLKLKLVQKCVRVK